MANFKVTFCSCPNCKAEVEIRRLVSTEGYVAVDLDYRTYARGADPTRLLVTRCQTCGFAEYTTDFAKAISDEAAKLTASADYQNLVSADRASDFPLVALMKRSKSERPERIGYCYLRASWFSADLGRDNEEKNFLNLAAQYFSESVDNAQTTTIERNRTRYLLGEIYRRLGDFGQAERSLSLVEDTGYAGLIRDQRNLINKGERSRRQIKAR